LRTAPPDDDRILGSQSRARKQPLPAVSPLVVERILEIRDRRARQCLDRRVPDVATLQADVRAWQEHRDHTATTVDWRFATQDARIKLKRLYPSIHE
jgi:hypothetical protein